MVRGFLLITFALIPLMVACAIWVSPISASLVALLIATLVALLALSARAARNMNL